MPLTLDDILVQPVTSGGVNATSAVTSLGSATTAGNTLLIFAGTYGTTGITTPSGYTRDTAAPVTTQKVYCFRKSNIGAGETLPTLATGASTQKTWWFALEVLSGTGGLDLTAPLDVAGTIATATAQSISTNAAAGTSYDAVAFSLFVGQDATSTTPPTWTWTSATAWQEVAEQGAADATTSYGAMLACLAPLTATALSAASATSSLAASGPLAAVGVKYQATGSRTAPDYRYIAGFEWGTSAGLTTGQTVDADNQPVGVRLLETKTGTVAVTSSTPRSGSYCLEVGSGTSGVHNATAIFPASTVVSAFYPFRFATLPATDTEVFALEGASGVHCVVRFIAATSKVGVKIGTATEQVSAETITAGAYHTVDVQYDVSVTGALTASWQLNGVDQPQATSLGSSTTCGTLRLGWTVASAAVMRVDDVIIAGRRGNWPLGNHKVVICKVDPAGTVLVNGTAGNLQTFTNNGTMAAWDATTARGAIDELPPTIGATADGLAQVTADAVTFVRIPMETHVAAANEAIRAVRMLACGWAAASQTNTVAFAGYSGSEPGFGDTLWATGTNPPLFTSSTTDPAWLCKMFTPSGGWDQAKLDALEWRFGASTDATPDVGLHAIYAEVAVAVGPALPLFGTLATQALDPLSGGILGVTVDTTITPGKAATLHYEESGTPTDVPVAADTIHAEPIGAPDPTVVNRIELYPDPES